jgi:acetylcholinesterase
MRFYNFSTLFAILVASGSSCPIQVPLGLRAETTSAVLEGFISPSTPNVRQFLGIPFSLPPTGSRRWLPPSKLVSNVEFTANDIGPACPQLTIEEYTTLNSSVYSLNGGNQTEFFPLHNFSEDCLTLNVWTPKNFRQDMPVIVWFFGVSDSYHHCT